MKLGFIGLGRMGSNMVLNLLDKGHDVIVHNRSPEPINELEKAGAVGAYTIDELFQKLDTAPKIIWLMVTAGSAVDDMIGKLLSHLQAGDIIIDGGNSYFEDSIRRAEMLKRHEIYFLDCGTSGGIEGARHGACMMVGGAEHAFRIAEPLFRDMCVAYGYGHMGSSGSGHFVKMVHNGIEYGMMAAIAEGMSALKAHEKKFGFDLKTIAKVYAHGSIVESRLMSWLDDSFQDKAYLDAISGSVPMGETEAEMEKLESIAKMPILNQARLMRVKSRENPSFEAQLIAAMRNKFGGHKVNKKLE